MMRSLALALLTVAAIAPAAAQTAAAEDALLERVRTGQIGTRAEEREARQRFARASEGERQQLLVEARRLRDQLQAESQRLEKATREKAQTFSTRLSEFHQVLGPNATMFGILETSTQELVGIFRSASTSLHFPERESWLNGLLERVKRSSQIFTIEDLEKLWFLLQQEISASGKIVTLDTEVLGKDGNRELRQVTRIGRFGLVTNDPEPAYLTWHPENQRAVLLKRQPDGAALPHLAAYLEARDGVHAVAIDPTAGSLLTRLVDAPSLPDRIAAGGLIGNLILILGAFGVSIAIFKLIAIIITSLKVAAQRRDLAHPSSGNPLGRLLMIYERNTEVDTETLEMRLGEALLAERPKIERYLGTVKVISAVAPLMGLMGTVIGMIATFQSITLFGTSDPKTMAGGISQALVTTVEGLTVAIPTVLLYAIASARAAALVNTLKHQTAGLIAERMEADAVAEG